MRLPVTDVLRDCTSRLKEELDAVHLTDLEQSPTIYRVFNCPTFRSSADYVNAQSLHQAASRRRCLGPPSASCPPIDSFVSYRAR